MIIGRNESKKRNDEEAVTVFVGMWVLFWL